MAKKHMKKCSTLLTVKVKKLKTSLRFYYYSGQNDSYEENKQHIRGVIWKPAAAEAS